MSDVPDFVPIEVRRSDFPPMRVGRYAFVYPEPPAPSPSDVTIAFIGRPDSAGQEPITVVSLTPDLALDLAVHLVRASEVARHAE